MAHAPQPRRFEVNPKNAQVPPLLLGFMGPPGGGKTKSALRVADGMCRVRGGKPFLIDTEAGRSLRYHRNHNGPHDFDFVQFSPPFTPEHFLDAIKQGVAGGAGCIIVDSMSDEHEGEGGVLDWHDQEVPKMGGNEWAAWSKPKASRRKLISGIQQIKVPVILTFRAREKTVTKQVERRGRMVNEPQNIGFQPVAPMEIVHTLDLTCLLPPRSDGVPVWDSPKQAEDFVIKLPEFLKPLIRDGAALDEELGVALAHWQAGDTVNRAGGGSAPQTTPAASQRASAPDEERVSSPAQTDSQLPIDQTAGDQPAQKSALELRVDNVMAEISDANFDRLGELRGELDDWLAKVERSKPEFARRIKEAFQQREAALLGES